MLLATLAHRADPDHTWVAHAVSPAVPSDATERVRNWAAQEGWQLSVVRSAEFEDENYLSNPVNRCYYCKSNLYDRLHHLESISAESGAVVLSGANTDDLGEYRPGLTAAAEQGVRHPYVEASISKSDIRRMGRELALPFAELPASPCLASRLYTGTRVTDLRLRAIEAGEKYLREEAALSIVRCRIRDREALVEVPQCDRHEVTDSRLQALTKLMQAIEPELQQVVLDPRPYQAGRAFQVNGISQVASVQRVNAVELSQ
jgi:uncharacterized protein